MEVIYVLSFTLLVLNGYSLNVNGKEFAPPRIFPEQKEYIISANDNFTLRCEGKEPVTWTYPNETYNDIIEPYKSSTITVRSSKTPDSEYIYGSILTIEMASYLDTGFFYCHGDTDDFEDLSRVSKVYVYVQDPEHLSVLTELPFAVTVTQYSQVILPCRPTSPDIQVELFQTTGDEIENVSYDPKIGFSFSANELSGNILYTCIFSGSENKMFELDVLVYIGPMTYSIAKPNIEELSGGHTVIGEKLHLKCTLKVDVQFTMEWTVPDKKGVQNGRIYISKSIRESHNQYYQELTINTTTLQDQGEYTCVVRDLRNFNNNTKFIRIFDTSDHFINLTEENGAYDISVRAGNESAQWRIDVEAHPTPELVWYDNHGKEIPAGWSDNKNTKYEIHTQSSSETFLKINDVTIYDRGTYMLKAINDFEEVTVKLYLNVTDKPTVDIQMSSFHLIHEPSIVKCIIAAYPIPSVYWFYKNCQDNSCDFEPKNPIKTDQQGLLLISYINVTASTSGYVMCMANNSLGTDKSIVGYFVTDVSNGFGIWGLDKDTAEIKNARPQYPIAVGEITTMYCAASRYNFTDQIKWSKIVDSKFVDIEENENYSIEKSTTEFSNKLTLTIKYTHYNDSGNYTCQVKEMGQDQFLYDNVTIAVRDPQAPKIMDTNLNNSDFLLNIPDKFQVWCVAKGIPKPIITWYKNNEEVIENSKSKMEFFNKRRMLLIQYTQAEDEGVYTCKAKNKMGTATKYVNLKFKNKPGINVIYIGIIIVMCIVFCFLIAYLYFSWKKEREMRRELKKAGLVNFENGAINSLNPELGIDDQAELLPYDKKWEFPREKLKLGKQLGSGAFGVVMKAVASGIVEDEESTVVAVKMVKRNTDYTYIRALASELKIMVHLGKHLNVVNLLGACTKNVAKRELLVIVEFCRFGNLHNYLLRHRNSFINQIDSKTGKIDYTFGSEIMERSFSVSSNQSDNNPLPKDMADYRGNFNYSGNTESTTFTMVPTGGDDCVITSSGSSVQPEWRSNYHGDYKGTVKPICTKDLITWSFQVARGMDYLASRRVLHGDLAARNILLAENNVVKICDFGLAKSMYKNDNYKKKGDGPLPVKWMAVESIRDRVFSTQSDIWSYGIVLWEFFSLARTPYPGMEADERLYNKLVDGYRMDSPEYATDEIYSMMCECWHPKPLLRPTFEDIAKKIGFMLEDSVRQHYVDLNDPYLVMNTQRFQDGQNDYLKMLSPPDFEHLSSPHHYVNDEIRPDASPDPNDTPGYLCMKSNIFSPREAEDNVFNFDVDPNIKHKNSNGEIALGTELLPMLRGRNESDCETPHLVTTPTGFSNPSYHIPPNIKEKTDEDIVKTADNYVNMPQNKSAIKNEHILNNSKNVNTDIKSNNYVNSNSRDWERIEV